VYHWLRINVFPLWLSVDCDSLETVSQVWSSSWSSEGFDSCFCVEEFVSWQDLDFKDGGKGVFTVLDLDSIVLVNNESERDSDAVWHDVDTEVHFVSLDVLGICS
jgi:hypothetical protein